MRDAKLTNIPNIVPKSIFELLTTTKFKTFIKIYKSQSVVTITLAKYNFNLQVITKQSLKKIPNRVMRVNTFTPKCLECVCLCVQVVGDLKYNQCPVCI